MIGRWWRERRAARLLRSRPIPTALWQQTLATYPFFDNLGHAELQQLRTLSTVFLADKEFSGANGLTVTDAMAVSIAAQACLPVLHLGAQAYDGFVGIVVHPNEVIARREITDATGVVHTYEETLSGEAMEGGPVMLSWSDVAQANASAIDGYNVVIHEFVHVLDMADGLVDGVPPLPRRIARAHWLQVLEAGLHRLRRQLDAGRDPFLDPYGAGGLDEFFPVASEAFFVAPNALQQEQPQLYTLLADYFGQDPASRQAQRDG